MALQWTCHHLLNDIYSAALTIMTWINRNKIGKLPDCLCWAVNKHDDFCWNVGMKIFENNIVNDCAIMLLLIRGLVSNCFYLNPSGFIWRITNTHSHYKPADIRTESAFYDTIWSFSTDLNVAGKRNHSESNFGKH